MKISFSTLGCPDWTFPQAMELAVRGGFDGIELRFVQGEASLWKLPDFSGAGLPEAIIRINDSGLAVCCVDTSCRFDSPNASERDRWIEEGVRMAELAARLGAPGIRVFGDRIQPGVERERTRTWIAAALNQLAQRIQGLGVEVWLETHGDFCCASEVLAVLADAADTRLVWDPVSAFVRCGERPLENGPALKNAIRHIHIKDVRRIDGEWKPVLTGSGESPLLEILELADSIDYAGFLSFEWEKKWHPEIEAPEIAIPHFANWFRMDRRSCTGIGTGGN